MFTYLEGLVFEAYTDKFLVSIYILLVASELKREDINLKINSKIDFLKFPIQLRQVILILLHFLLILRPHL